MTVKKLRTRLKKRKQSVSDVKGKEELVQWLLSVAPLLPFPVDGSSAMAAPMFHRYGGRSLGISGLRCDDPLRTTHTFLYVLRLHTDKLQQKINI
jgi:hypothetical protein